jgi:hypothetical protein
VTAAITITLFTAFFADYGEIVCRCSCGNAPELKNQTTAEIRCSCLVYITGGWCTSLYIA